MEDGGVRIPLRDIKRVIRAYALVDAADADYVNQWRWHLDKDGYAFRLGEADGRKTSVYLHRELLGLKRGDGRIGDHINRDRLDNRRTNLRAVPILGNNQNKSGHSRSTSAHRGVSWDARRRLWQAIVRTTRIGWFADELEAAEAARAARQATMPYALD